MDEQSPSTQTPNETASSPIQAPQSSINNSSLETVAWLNYGPAWMMLRFIKGRLSLNNGQLKLARANGQVVFETSVSSVQLQPVSYLEANDLSTLQLIVAGHPYMVDFSSPWQTIIMRAFTLEGRKLRSQWVEALRAQITPSEHWAGVVKIK